MTSNELKAFRDELTKEAGIGGILGSVGKGIVGAAGGAAKGGLIRNATGGALNLARKAGFSGDSAYKALGGAALGAGALGAAGVGALGHKMLGSNQ